MWSYNVGDMICDTKVLDPEHRKGLAMRLGDLFYLSHRPLERRLEEYFGLLPYMHRHRTNLVSWQDLFSDVRLANPSIRKPGISARLYLPIDELIETVQLIEGVHSDWSLPDRALEKLERPDKSRKKKDSPLKWASILLMAVRHGWLYR